MKPHQDQPANRRDLYILKAEEIYLKSRKLPLNGFRHHLVSEWRGFAYPVNESAALVWECCRESIRVADLVQALTSHFPESTSLESEILDILDQYHTLGLLTFSQEPHRIPMTRLQNLHSRLSIPRSTPSELWLSRNARIVQHRQSDDGYL